MNLKKLNTSQLDQRIKSLFKNEREILHDILLTIKEIDQRRMYLEMGYSSLFDYLTLNVGYPNGSAQRRIDAARLLADVPSAAEKILSGDLNLSQINLIQKASREVFKTTSQKVSAEHKEELIEQISKKDQRDSEIQVAAFFDLPVVEKTKVKAQRDESVRVELTLSKELFEKIQEAQALLSHALGNKDLVKYLEYVTDRVIKQKTSVRTNKDSQRRNDSLQKKDSLSKKDLFSKKDSLLKKDSVLKKDSLPNGSDLEKQKSSESESSRSISPKNTTSIPSNLPSNLPSNSQNLLPNGSEKPNQAFSARTKKIVLKQQLCCQFVDPITKKICGSKWFLQVDHKHSRWADGTNDPQNAQILCGAHNRMKYKKENQIKFK